MTQPDDRAPARADFIARHQRVPAPAALPADASPRRYYRLEGTGELLMEVTPNAPDFTAFITVSNHLRALGLSAPRILAAEPDQGYALIEDFGADTFTRLLASGADEVGLYELAVDALIALHNAPAGAQIALPAYDEAPLFEELRMFTRWYVPNCAPGVVIEAFEEKFLALWRAALAPVSATREALVLRDYHVDNLMVLPNRLGPARCGLLDFQDALLGSAAYDLVSLTQDARRDLAEGLEAHLLRRYLAHRPGVDEAGFRQAFWLLGAHRHTKILGNFERLSKRDGKHGYLAHLPRVQRLCAQALEQAGLSEIIALMDAELPGWRSHRPQPSSR
ncbi:aminoglycoside phosphotransferase family protein [Acidocella sp.]|uniref:aminoglycoside phosphotransferase family protein n=1 Tax=Acidocella sp. TaxID=50710 RepID=UPI0026350331|nr:phosphotransferase [Acidocella sp.]